MSRIEVYRVVEIDGQQHRVPPFLQRTVCGWQVRIRGIPTEHFADTHYGGALTAMQHAEQRAQELEKRAKQRAC